MFLSSVKQKLKLIKYSHPVQSTLIILTFCFITPVAKLFGTYAENIGMFWFPAGVSVAVLFYGGFRFAPVLVVAIFIGNSLTFFSASGNVFTDFLISVGAFMQAVVLVSLLKFFKVKTVITDLSSIFKVTLISIISTPVSAFVGCATFYYRGVIKQPDLVSNFATWMLGDLLGISIVLPLIACFFERSILLERVNISMAERIACFIVLVLTAVTVFRDSPFNLPFLIGLPVVWSVLRLDFFTNLLNCFVLICIASLFTVMGQGPFGSFGAVNLQANLIFIQISIVSLAVAVGQKRRSEKSLIESSILLRSIFNGIHDAIFIKDRNLRYVKINPTAAAMTGKTPEEIIGHGDHYIFPEEVANRIIAIDKKIIEEEKPLLFEEEIPSSTGQVTSRSTSKFPLYDADNKVVGLIGIARDITEIKTVFSEYKKNYNLLESVFQTSDAIFVKDLQSNFIMINKTGASWMGKKLEDVIGKNIKELFSESDCQQIELSDCDVIEDGMSKTYQYCLTFKGNKELEVSTTKAPFYNSNGEIIGVIGITRDITESVKNAEKLNHFASIVASTDNAIIGVSLDGFIRSWNPAAEKCLGYSASEAIGQHLFLIVPLVKRLETETLLTDVRNGKHVDHYYTLQRCKDKSLIQVIITISAMANAKGEFDGFSIIQRDITKQLQAEEALRRSEVAEAANRTKSQFVATISHEIRTPISVMMGFAELIKNEDDPEARKKYIDTVMKSGAQLVSLIDDILDIAKIEAGVMKVESGPIMIESLLSDLLDMFSVTATQKNIDFLISYKTPIPEVIQTDLKRLRQVLVNLIGNAFKFTEKGFVKIELEYVAEIVSRPKLIFKIIDSGCGMTVGQAQGVFERFNQGDDAVPRKFGGTGLGLAISKNLAQLLGGDVVLEEFASKKGSAFSFSIEVGLSRNIKFLHQFSAAGKNVQPSALQELQNLNQIETILKVLIVEDGEDNRLLLSHFLKDKCFHLDFAENGLKGLDLVKKNGAYDLILMDMQMPVMDGYQASTALRAIGFKNPIIALTANAMKEEKTRCFKAGCDDYLAKPVDRATLIKTIYANYQMKH